jgi:hypothetical protein
MSHKIRLNRLEKMRAGDRLWALIGIGKPRDGTSTLEKQRGVCSLNRSGTCSYLRKLSYGESSKKTVQIFPKQSS